MTNTFRTYGVIILFLVFISFPLINDNFRIVKDTENRENRALAEKPNMDINLLDPYPAAFEKYYNDHFTLRFRMVNYFNAFNLVVYKKSPFPGQIVVGYNDWLYLEGYEMETYRGTMWFSDEQVKKIATFLEVQRKYLEERNCKFYVMLTPTKPSIHSENIPHTYYRYNLKSYGEKLEEYLIKNTNINIISLFEPFLEIKKTNQLYYKHDVHWNAKGGFYASIVASSQISKDVPNVKPLSPSDFVIAERTLHGGDLIGIIGGEDTNEDSDFDFTSLKTNKPVVFGSRDCSKAFAVKIDTKDTTKPSLILMSDSYASRFFPFIAQSFGKSIHVFDFWHYALPKDLIEKEKPDVYLLMIHEPLVRNLFEDPK